MEDTKKLEHLKKMIDDLKSVGNDIDVAEEIRRLETLSTKLEREIIDNYTAWDKVQIARMMDRPRSIYYINQFVTDFVELHGDRSFKDDQAIIGGIGKIGEHVVTIIAQNKGKNAKENIERNFGMPHPEGYRKALRLMKQAEKFHRPVVCLIDTPGAYCGLGAEERGQGEAIARNLMEMARLKTPIIAGVIGEGGSGGALALGVADRVFMQENTTYSILSPEGFASILWKDSSKAREAAEMMKITAVDLLESQIIDNIVNEPLGGAHKAPEEAAKMLETYLISQLDELSRISKEDLVNQRYERFRKYGTFFE
ncbi:acetyl-CoA carboxylase carboxyltransferase subunit alpha [Niameybacter massiliensis]|uniref:Acetyl-coenzyme A carboxylase carboxyl transferase subunit alpha n=1 Tax=Holtiella tumoricola TaxID=3018743 RepID=A0AA42DKK0_9FIRM|nr:acetyl-CoA carboxylase carboxyltransferase subunit alpha [Holtiella tumoricola]MDA3730483.1 acetyl-CoA carboxylase carboxyltransferase subunit alpha [Holtiella tumoricola]